MTWGRQLFLTLPGYVHYLRLIWFYFFLTYLTDACAFFFFFFFFQALVRVKALQDCCVAKEGVIGHVRKHDSTLMKE